MNDREFQAAVQHLDALVQEFENLPYPQIRERVFELLQTIDAVHREGLSRLIDSLRREGAADAVEQAAEDPVINTLLALYDLASQADQVPATPPTTQHFISLDQVERATARYQVRRPTFEAVASVKEVPAGTMQAFDVDGVHVLIANVEGELYAVHNQCPGSMAPLNLGHFDPPIVICPWHNEAFDVRTGKRTDGEDTPTLDVVPVDVEAGTIRVDANMLENKAALNP